MLLVFERALRGDADLEVMLAGVPDHPPRTLHSVVSNSYNIKVIVPSRYHTSVRKVIFDQLILNHVESQRKSSATL